MKKLKYLKFAFFLSVFISCSNKKTDLYKTTDLFIDSLQNNYKSYGVFNAEKNIRITPDSFYQVTPIGRLINVKILKVVDSKEYEELKTDIKEHYKNDKRVNDVYINKFGTIIIDCRD